MTEDIWEQRSCGATRQPRCRRQHACDAKEGTLSQEQVPGMEQKAAEGSEVSEVHLKHTTTSEG